MNSTNIEWTDATWNPIRGCSKVSEGCRNCYAEKVANRFSGEGLPYEGLVHVSKDGRGLGWNGNIQFVEEHLLDPLRWKPVKMHEAKCGKAILGKQAACTCANRYAERPRRIFVNSMSDFFHENVTDEMLDRIFAVMALCSRHTFQVLTKRPERMLRYFSDLQTSNRVGHVMDVIYDDPKLINTEIDHPGWSFICGGQEWDPLPNVWLGVSVENQLTADKRIPLLLQTPAAVRFVSYEPGLELVNFGHGCADGLPVFKTLKDARMRGMPAANDLGDVPEGWYRHHGNIHPWLDWVIVGGESGPGARPFNVEWARSMVEQCAAAGVACFVKQLGAKPVSSDTSCPQCDSLHRTYGKCEVCDGTRMVTPRWPFRDRKGGNMSEWPEDLRVRQFPEVRA